MAMNVSDVFDVVYVFDLFDVFDSPQTMSKSNQGPNWVK